ncbi:MAG: ABC transporter ATP-binding protein [Caldiserica bacterium]|jgi:iron complex transport system ATP-binding protein|nr:ABC transporter ATP-binding protein [Caldisericota bacterium]MDH7562538.1 ABC transporter ATP-binding protein [Caldisericota bacterium]
MKALSLAGVSFSYFPGKPVIRDLSFSLEKGLILALLGPNGSGKTTLLHLILGQLSPQNGEIEIFGREIRSYSRSELSKLMGLARQEERVAFEFTVLEYVLLGRAPYLNPLESPRGEDLKVALQSLERTGTLHLKDRYLTSLSGGEKQLVIISRALAQMPGILLLDEPLAHLDLRNQSMLLEVLSNLKDDGVTVIFSTHDPNSAGVIADRVLLLRKSSPSLFGRPEEVLHEESLRETYGIPVRVMELEGRRMVFPHNGRWGRGP